MGNCMKKRIVRARN
ncbi:hypothetical protein RDI58_029420 [Solanum bulbocastanum]|uniref:Uncharacterized protein n=1 Tax=Solanum bulbocastanum TaxID=147425 RepID=A0AAN8SWJ6_SOLBU